jgi:hypothetical protein
MNDFWWGSLAFGPASFIVGIATTLLLAATTRRLPMDGRTYTGRLPTHLADTDDEDEDDTFRRLIRDLNGEP